MNNETKKIYPKGLFANKPRENAPDFVKGSLSLHKTTLIEWLSNFQANEKGYINLDVKEGRDGEYYVEVNTFVKKETSNEDTERARTMNEARKKAQEDAQEMADKVPF
jgi:hypothetical protein